MNANVKSFNELLVKVQEWYYKTFNDDKHLNSDKQKFQVKIIEVKRIPFLSHHKILQKLKPNWHKIAVSSGLSYQGFPTF